MKIYMMRKQLYNPLTDLISWDGIIIKQISIALFKWPKQREQIHTLQLQANIMGQKRLIPDFTGIVFVDHIAIITRIQEEEGVLALDLQDTHLIEGIYTKKLQNIVTDMKSLGQNLDLDPGLDQEITGREDKDNFFIASHKK